MRRGEVPGHYLFSARDIEPPAPGTPLGPDPVDKPPGDFEDEPGIGFLPVGGIIPVAVPVCQQHDLEGACPHLEEALEEEVVEDQPGEIGPVDELIEIVVVLVDLLKGTTAERAAPFHQLIEVDFLLASGAGGVGGVYS